MKPEKAISIINDYDVYFEGHTAEEIVDAMELAIEALQKQIPKPVEETHVLRTETHAVRSDTISRQAAIDAVYERIKQIGYENSLPILSVGQAIQDLPSAEKTGKWIDTGSGTECSECHEIMYGYDNYRNYCQYCGSYNGGEQDGNV